MLQEELRCCQREKQWALGTWGGSQGGGERLKVVFAPIISVNSKGKAKGVGRLDPARPALREGAS